MIFTTSETSVTSYCKNLVTESFTVLKVSMHPRPNMISQAVVDTLLSEALAWVKPPRDVKPLYQEIAEAHLAKCLLPFFSLILDILLWL